MVYHILEHDDDAVDASATLMPYAGFSQSWHAGNGFGENRPPNPMELNWDPNTEDKRRLAYYEGTPVLMRKDLVSAIRCSGVDNIETYPVIIRSHGPAAECHDYLGVNIVGAITAADMDESVIEDESDGLIDVLFNEIVIEPDRARGQLLFRLAESQTIVVIHDAVAKCIGEQGGFGLSLA